MVEALPLLFCVRCSSFPNRFDAGGAIRCTDSGRKNAMWQSCRLRWEKINVKRYGWKLYRFAFRGCSSFPNRLDAGGAIQCTDSGRENALRQSCRLRWQKINIKQYGWKLYRFAFRGCSSLPKRLDAGEIIRCTDSSRENCIFVPERVMYRYFPCHTIWLYTKFACKVGIPARFNKRKQNKRYGEKTIPLVFYATIFVGKYSRKQSNRGGKTKNGEQKKPCSDFFHSP